jgi:CheY-like chemotaxis protein
MTQPLALVFYEKLFPGSRLVNRLQDLNYRVQTITTPDLLHVTAAREKPLLIFLDLMEDRPAVFPAIREVKSGPDTQHIPVIIFISANAKDVEAAALAAGANLVVAETAIIDQLAQIIDQALQIL